MVKNMVKIIVILLGINLVLLFPTVFFITWLEKIPDKNAILFLTLAYSFIPLVLYYIAALKFVHSQNKKYIIASSTLVFIICVGLFFMFKTNTTFLLIYPFIPIVVIADNAFGISQSVSFCFSMLISTTAIMSGATVKTRTRQGQ